MKTKDKEKWETFAKTGSVQSYLDYRGIDIVKYGGVAVNVDQYTRADNQRKKHG